MIKLVIFDLDGTLVNSLYDLADAVNLALKDNGYPTHELDEYRYFVGNGAKKLVERALPPETSAQETERIYQIFSVNYREHCLDKTKPYDGMPELVKALHDIGYMCAVASNKPDEFSKQIVGQLFDEGCFDLIRGKLDGVKSKPAPDIVLDIMKALNADTTQTIMIGDSNTDILTAHNSGIKCIGCEWGFRGRDELITSGADFIVKTPDDISDILRTL